MFAYVVHLGPDLFRSASGAFASRAGWTLRERSIAGRGGAVRHQRQDGAGHLEPRHVDRRDGAALD